MNFEPSLKNPFLIVIPAGRLNACNDYFSNVVIARSEATWQSSFCWVS
jgi:hypothetical protein